MIADFLGIVRGEYNRFTNLDSLEWRIINHLLNSTTKTAEKIWKLLKYPTPDALLKENLTRKQKLALIHIPSDEEETSKRVFMTPFVDDTWSEQNTHIHFYVDSVMPLDKMQSMALISIELLTHSKINSIMGEATGENPTGQNQYTLEGEPLILYKNRLTTLLQLILSELNGLDVEGVGFLEFNQQLNRGNVANHYLWNNRAFFGFGIKMGVRISAPSAINEC